MRTITPLVLAVVILSGLASPAEAQFQFQDWVDRGYFHISLGGQSQDQTFEDSSTFPIYQEQGAVASAHSYGGGTLVDVAAGYRVWRNLAVGLGFSSISNENDAAVSVRVPHPIFFGQSRTATATAADLSHSENVVHLQASWMMPINEKIQVMFFFGPSFFTVRQQVATVRAPQDINEGLGFQTVNINAVTVTEHKDSPVGVNIGFDGTYLVTPMFGAGLFVRYAGASMDLPTDVGVTRTGDSKVGGAQVGLGLRVRF